MYLYQFYVTGMWWQCNTGKVPVVIEESIPWNPDSDNITISTNSVAGSGEEVGVMFYDKDGNVVGGVGIRFFKQIKYWIELCANYSPFPVTPTTETQKTWTITYNYTDMRLVLHCNRLEVLNVVLSNSSCALSYWGAYWDRKPTQIKFASYWDTASDSYCISSNTATASPVTQLENERPISTLPIFGKIFEKLIYKRLYTFFVAQNLLLDKQFGFRKNHSTSHDINYSIQHINQAIKTKNTF